GLDEHMTAVAEMQAKIGVSEGDLLCGTHPPFDKPTAHRLQMTGESATPNRHNCSGKHTGMLATAKHLREPL
ncbi:MAG: asparaginase, partial [Planctomycetales bacterium]|nr:asparaginase [Planctomycetales bacterium]